MNRLLIVLLLSLYIIISEQSFAQTTTIGYTSSSFDIGNPERGIYHYAETHSNGYTSLDATQLQNFRINEGITVVYRIFYLEDFVSSNISSAYLTNVQNDFDQIRQAGLKCIVRFAYTDQTNGWPPVAPYGDATKAWMLTHITQLAPYLKANADVIAVMNAGFIGIWGEWYYTTYFGDPANGPLTATNYADRKEVADSLLSALPSTRMIQLRTPLYKYTLYRSGSLSPVTSTEAYSGVNVSRIGHHNDCFLASSTDYGTYVNTSTEYPYLQSDTKYVPMGGETCALNVPRTDCTGNAINELSGFHWSLLNRDYINSVWDNWISEGCSLQIKESLGYRFQLNSGSYSTTAKPGGSVNINLSLTNVGWAAPYNPRLVEVVLENTSDGTVCRARLPVDPRFWLSGNTENVNYDIGIPSNFPNGTYKLYLSLPDPENTLYENPSYSIRLANSNTTWDGVRGYNYLSFDLTISDTYVSGDYTGSLWFEQCYGSLPLQWLEFSAENKGVDNYLSWKTKEAVGDYFIIERSTDGKTFEMINEIQIEKDGPGFYSYNDYFNNRITYYRIKQVQNNGSFSYSPVRVCVASSGISISPNPFAGQTKLEISESYDNITIEILDMTGKVILKKIQLVSNVQEIGKDLPIGAYILRVIVNEDCQYLRLIKNSN